MASDSSGSESACSTGVGAGAGTGWSVRARIDDEALPCSLADLRTGLAGAMTALAVFCRNWSKNLITGLGPQLLEPIWVQQLGWNL